MGISNRVCWVAAGATLFLTTPALAQTLPMYLNTTCEPYDTISKTLEDEFKEKKLALGMSLVFIIDGHPDNTYPAQGVMALWTNQDSGTYTVTVTFDDAMTCILTTGANFEPYTGN